jgi:hypothetical protein
MNLCASFHLPLLHILVEERVGERRLSFDGRFMERGSQKAPPLPVLFLHKSVEEREKHKLHKN